MTIRTPDQRVRVFVSSMLQELAAERQAAAAAITQLRLTPVLFELGAPDDRPALEEAHQKRVLAVRAEYLTRCASEPA
jgi:hypothetical protein